jgi:hypothetical protein
MVRDLTRYKLSLCLDRKNNQVISELNQISQRVNLETNFISRETVRLAKDTSRLTRSNVLVRYTFVLFLHQSLLT